MLRMRGRMLERDAGDSIATRSSGRPRPSRRNNLPPSHKSSWKSRLRGLQVPL